MCSRAELHHENWLHDRAFLERIDDEFPDWIIIVAFYAALHCVEMLFAADKTPSSSDHGSRNRSLRGSKRYEQIWKHYRPLYDLCQTVRYSSGKSAWVSAADAKNLVVGVNLYQIEKSALKLAIQSGLKLSTGGEPPGPVKWMGPPGKQNAGGDSHAQ